MTTGAAGVTAGRVVSVGVAAGVVVAVGVAVGVLVGTGVAVAVAVYVAVGEGVDVPSTLVPAGQVEAIVPSRIARKRAALIVMNRVS